MVDSPINVMLCKGNFGAMDWSEGRKLTHISYNLADSQGRDGMCKESFCNFAR